MRVPCGHAVLCGSKAIVALAVLCSVIFPARVRASAGDFATYKREALAAHEAEFARLAAEQANDEAFLAFKQRLELIDEVAGPMISRFRSARAASLKSLLSDVVAQPKNSQTNEDMEAGMSAVEIIAEYQDRFAVGLPKPPVSEEDMAFLRTYYDTTARAAGRFVAENGRFIEAIGGKNATEVLELCLVMPFLHIPDQQWSQTDTEAMPDWMKSPANLSILESFALRVRRPFTAYQFADFRLVRQGQEADERLKYADYLLLAAEGLVNSRQFYAGIHCLRTGVQLAEEDKNQKTAVALHFQLADVYRMSGHLQLAAEEMKRLLEKYPEASECGKAAMLRLKYLYEAGQFKNVNEEYATYRQVAFSKPYLPQILYIAWVSHRRENKTEAADKLQEEFIRAFPKHPLVADMYFSSAMTALAASDYEEAGRLLEIIEYRFPNSRLQQKVKQIQKRLKKMISGDARSK